MVNRNKPKPESQLSNKAKAGIIIGLVMAGVILGGVLYANSITPIDTDEDYDYIKIRIVDYANNSLVLNGTFKIYGQNVTGLTEVEKADLDLSTFVLIDTIDTVNTTDEFEVEEGFLYWVRVEAPGYDFIDFVPMNGLTQVSLLRNPTSFAATMLSKNQLKTNITATEESDWSVMMRTLDADGEIVNDRGARRIYDMLHKRYSYPLINITLNTTANVDYISAPETVNVRAIGNSLILEITGVIRGEYNMEFSFIDLGESFEVESWNFGAFIASTNQFMDLSSQVV